MRSLFQKFIGIFGSNEDKNLDLERGVKHSVEKYYNTYKLLEKYDQKSRERAKVLVDDEDLRGYFQSLR